MVQDVLPRARRRWLRRIGWLAVAMFVVVASVAAVSQTAAVRDWLRRAVLARVNARLLGRVEVGRLEGNLFGGLVLTDVRVVLEGRRVLAIRRLAASYDPWTLVRGGDLRLTAVAVDGLAVLLAFDARGWNIDRLVAPAPTPSASVPALAIDLGALRVRNGAVRIVRPEHVWRLRGLVADGAARIAPHATDLAIDALSFTEATSGIRVEEASARIRGRAAAGWTAADVRLRTGGSRVTGEGTFGPNVEAALAIDRLAADEVKALLRSKAPASDWRGELHASGPRAAVVLGGTLAGTSDDPDPRSIARLRVDGTLGLDASPPVGDVTAAFEHVDLVGVVGTRLPSTDLTGRIVLANRTEGPGAFTFGLDLDASRIVAMPVTSAHATGRVGDGEVRFDLDVARGAGGAHAAGVVAPGAERFDLQADVREIDLGEISGRPELAGRVTGGGTLRGEGFAPARIAAMVALTFAPSRVGAVSISNGRLDAHAEHGTLFVDRAALATSAGTAEASGDLVLGSDEATRVGGLRVGARATDLRPLAALLGRPDVGGAATLDLTMRGSVHAFEANGTLAARGISGNGWRAAEADVGLVGHALGTSDGAAEVHGSARELTLGSRRLTDVTLTGSGRGSLASATASLDLQAREVEGRHALAAAVTWDADTTRARITTLRFDDRGATWTATGTPVVTRRGERIAVDGLELRSSHGALRVQGGVGGGPSDLDLVVDGLDLEALAGLVPDQVRGRLEGRVHLGGTLALPRLDADVALAAPTLAGTSYDELRARCTVGDGRGELHGRLAKGRQTLVLDGTAPVALGLAPARLVIGDPQARVRADAIDVGFIGALWPGLVTKLGGTIDGDVTIAGSVATPEAHGRITLAGGRGYVVPLGVTYDPVDVVLTLDGHAAAIDRLTITSAKGRLTGGGSTRLGPDGVTMDARFQLASFPLFANQYGRGAANGWLWISGTLAAPVVEGTLETDGLVLQIPEALATSVKPLDPTIVVVGPGAPPPALEAASASAPATVPSIFDRAALTVQIDVPRDAWIRRSDANVELKGWMTAWKKPGDELHLAGDIRGVRGWYAFQGKKFTLVEGSSVRFSGQGLDPVLDITATHQAGDYLVRLRVGGTVTKPALTLESEPALDQADVLSVLLFGSPSSQLTRSQSAGLREHALGIAGGYVASELRESVANALGVDDLQFDTGTTGLQDARVSVGKYVADDVFVSLAHRFGQTAEEVRVEWIFRPEWSIETSTDTLGRSGVDVFWKRRY